MFSRRSQILLAVNVVRYTVVNMSRQVRESTYLLFRDNILNWISPMNFQPRRMISSADARKEL
jgi:hypothetical protein